MIDPKLADVIFFGSVSVAIVAWVFGRWREFIRRKQ